MTIKVWDEEGTLGIALSREIRTLADIYIIYPSERVRKSLESYTENRQRVI
jgi:hypothetical protein